MPSLLQRNAQQKERAGERRRTWFAAAWEEIRLRGPARMANFRQELMNEKPLGDVFEEQCFRFVQLGCEVIGTPTIRMELLNQAPVCVHDGVRGGFRILQTEDVQRLPTAHSRI